MADYDCDERMVETVTHNKVYIYVYIYIYGMFITTQVHRDLNKLP